jgi:hypothetical protein
MSSTFRAILAELSDPTARTQDEGFHDHSPFHLASLADCASPDSIESPGAVFLARVARDVTDYVSDAEDADPRDALANVSDWSHGIADSAVPVYTHERWATFVDLGAYNEDVSDYGAMDDLTNAAGVALYMIAERLVHALAEELSEALDADAAEREDADDEEQDTRPDGSTVYYTRDPSDGYYTATTANGVQIGPGRFETLEDARTYLASLDALTDA